MANVTPRQQAIRTLLAGIDDTRFTALKSTLEQSRAAIDARIALLDAARGQIVHRKAALDTVLARMNAPNGLTDFRNAMVKGERLSVKVQKPKVETPKPARRRTGGTGPRSGGGTTPRP